MSMKMKDMSNKLDFSHGDLKVLNNSPNKLEIYNIQDFFSNSLDKLKMCDIHTPT